MVHSSTTTTFALLSAIVPAALAVRLDFTGVRTSQVANNFPNLAAKFPKFGDNGFSPKSFAALDLNDSKDLSYLIDLKLGGKAFTVSIDTGSTDFWVEGTVPNADVTGQNATIQYAKGAATGPVKTADLEIAGVTVKAQAFLNALENDSGSPGIIGLGPATGSVIFNKFQGDAEASPPLDRIFGQNKTSQRFITTTLGRMTEDPTSTYPGQLTIDEVLPGYEAILTQPKLLNTETKDVRNQHWQTLLDADGFTVNGKAVTIPSTDVVTTQNPKQLTVVFDNGFSLPQMPKSMVDAIYRQVPGSQFSAKDKLWVLPCDSEINVVFKFGGVSYPVHPLDAVISVGGPLDAGCAGSFQPIEFDSGNQLDIILGMAFLKNVYMLNSFGTLATSAVASAGAPYTQMLSLTNDTNRAHEEFQAVRVRKVGSGGGSGSGSSGGGKSGAVSLKAGAFAGVVALVAAFAMW